MAILHGIPYGEAREGLEKPKMGCAICTRVRTMIQVSLDMQLYIMTSTIRKLTVENFDEISQISQQHVPISFILHWYHFLNKSKGS